MSKTQAPIPLGTECPDFQLFDTLSKQTIARDDFAERQGLLVAFLCNHCPYVKHIREAFAGFGRDYQAKGLAIVAINSNDVARYPDDHPDRMAEEATAVGYTFPYLFDESQQVAAAFGAACTPEFFLFGPDRRLAYHGRFDGSRPGSDAPVTGNELRAAADDVLAGREVSAAQQPAIGCGIKWKP
jgi:thiol-disulfide isomerase/thioredoxin